MVWGRRAVAWIVGIALAGCGGEPATPEAQIRRLIGACEAAAESRDAERIQAFVAADYADEAGRDARTIRSFVGLQLLRREQVHLLTRIARIELDEDAPDGVEADVLLHLAMAGSPIAGLEALRSVQASLYRVELGLQAPADAVVAGDWQGWRVHRARFRRATLEDFVRD